MPDRPRPPVSPGPPVDDASASTGRTVLDGFESSELTEAFEGLYQQLKTMARGQLRKRARGGTLCTTELVHELYLRFTRQGSGAAVDRSHFMALSARAMRHIIIDHARERVRVKRGGEQIRTQLDEHLTADDIDVEREATFLLAFDQALEQLGQRDPRLASTCELRFFGGFSTVETAEILGVSTPTVKRDSRLARLFLSRALEGGAAASERV